MAYNATAALRHVWQNNMDLPTFDYKPESHVLALLGPETERGCALVASEILRGDLGDLIQAVFDKHELSKDKSKLLLDNVTSPVGAFAMRVLFARAFGLISEPTFSHLEALRKVRNECAHGVGYVSFSDADIAPLIAAMKTYAESTDGLFGAFSQGKPLVNWSLAPETVSPEKQSFVNCFIRLRWEILLSLALAMQGKLISPILQNSLLKPQR